MNETIEWIEAPDPSPNYAAARGKHEPGTGTWFTQGTDFADWKGTPGARMCVYGTRKITASTVSHRS